ncbi:hypothetical protein ACFLU6_03145 [Acidobacteriota bacterium]
MRRWAYRHLAAQPAVAVFCLVSFSMLPAAVAQESRALDTSLFKRVNGADDPPSHLKDSVHKGLECSDCHIEGKHDEEKPHLGTTACTGCHEAENLTYRVSAHGMRLSAGDPDAPLCWTCHGRHSITSPQTDEMEFKKRIVRICLNCHTDERLAGRHDLPPAAIMVAYQWSVHGQAVLKERDETGRRPPVCVDCHGAHNAHPIDGAAHPENKFMIEKICSSSECHQIIGEEYEGSIHWKALADGELESPSCTDCHGEHSIFAHTDPRSFVGPKKVTKTCSACHDSMKISAKLELETNRYESYSKSVHGIFSFRGDMRVANCASCHGAHDIRPASDPDSMISKVNLARTCGQCHPGSPADFTGLTIHEDPVDVWIFLSRYGRDLDYWLAGFVILLVAGYFSMFVVILFKRKKLRQTS